LHDLVLVLIQAVRLFCLRVGIKHEDAGRTRSKTSKSRDQK
jgi:hypothetical protein